MDAKNDLKRKIGEGIRATLEVRDAVDAVNDTLRRQNSGQRAQMGFHGVVTGPQTFHVESGRKERVDITPVGSEEGKVIQVNASLKPVVVPLADQGGWLISFIQEATEDERLTISDKAIRRSH
jgi:hypothetical protein